MDESSGKGSKVQAHIISGVVMDITAFEVSHAVGGDNDATALQANKAERVTFHRGDGTLHMGSIRRKAHRLPRTHMAMVSIPVGRWMKVQGKVQ